MKLCEYCGFNNFDVVSNKKGDRICEECCQVIEKKVKHHSGIDGNVVEELLPQSDERGNFLNYWK